MIQEERRRKGAERSSRIGTRGGGGMVVYHQIRFTSNFFSIPTAEIIKMKNLSVLDKDSMGLNHLKK